jgi:hypothetical protein
VSNDDVQWIYEASADASARFVLGTVGDNPLVCFGINPSIAVPNSLDPTVRRVKGLSTRFEFDSWTMLNVYPQIATLPKDITRSLDRQLKLENERQIEKLIDGRKLTLLGAWGGLITSRPYLPALLEDIVGVTDAAGCTWVSYGDPLKDGHPQHLSRAAGGLPLVAFDIDAYVPRIVKRRSP